MNTFPPLPEPAVEVDITLYADHQGTVAAYVYLPEGTPLFTAEQMRQYVCDFAAKLGIIVEIREELL